MTTQLNINHFNKINFWTFLGAVASMLTVIPVLYLQAKPVVSIAQSRIISGKVIAKEDSLPIRQAIVSLKGSNVRVLTDENGHFKLDVHTEQSIICVYVGYKTQYVRLLYNVSVYKIVLVPDSTIYDEIGGWPKE